jgi:hypothetical protein
LAFLFSDSLFGLFSLNGSGNGSFLPEHFDFTDGIFAVLTLYLIIKFVNALRPLFEE